MNTGVFFCAKTGLLNGLAFGLLHEFCSFHGLNAFHFFGTSLLLTVGCLVSSN
ncbi:MAG: hypothetical protein K0R17_479 [Rariglobus sp.]|jgi:hypothetical protein|nr:hypothetical protein [Rariglobus sp.]